ncbi:MFS transporter [Gulosibacter sp. 10]|uniref:MFS transporter n=1 Tax=Gulosibacter sp. 10 TaxID=1255570 RepID=UPI00097EB59B|nr:MFS transporter [Gulosibacter sp. 10]SJM70503.1 hypothetical protein FM112_15270 [Gulosibacter sp. 10]
MTIDKRRIAAAIRRAQLLMIGGLLAAYLGAQIVEGSVSGMIALGVIGVAWLPAYQTLTQVEDALAVLVSKGVERRPPGAVLVVCEACTLLLALAALLVVWLAPAWAVPVIIAYLVLTSIFPLLADLAEEFYLNDLARYDARATIRGNVLMTTGISAAGLILGRPLGALATAEGLLLVLAAAAACALLALILRWASARTFSPDHALDEDEEPREAAASREAAEDSRIGTRTRLRRLLRPLRAHGALSPLISGWVSLITGIVGGYLALWIAGHGARAGERLSLVLLVTGVAATVVPVLVGHAFRRRPERARSGLRGLVAVACSGYPLMLLSAMLHGEYGIDRLWTLAGLTVMNGAWLAVSFAISTARQLELDGGEFRRVIGWTFSLSALGAIAGAWAGYAMSAAAEPLPALGVGAVLSAGLLGALVVLERRRRRSGAVGR